MTLPPVVRIVTGHDDEGLAVITTAGAPPDTYDVPALPGTTVHEIWRTAGAPAPVDNGPDLTVNERLLQPPDRGTVVRIVDIAPEPEDIHDKGSERMRELFEQLKSPDSLTDGGRANNRHPMMHRTETVDYAVVLDSEITMLLDKGEVVLGPGGIVVQRGTNHAWSNRSGRPCRMMFVLVDGEFAPPPAERFKTAH